MDSGEKQQFSLISRKCIKKVNREKTLEQLVNMGIQKRMMEFIRELICERWIKVRMGGYISQSKQRDLRTLQGGVFSVILFLVVINGILGELRNGVDESLFADDIAIYITTRNQRVPNRAMQGMINKLDAWTAERGLAFPPSKSESMTFRKRKKGMKNQ